MLVEKKNCRQHTATNLERQSPQLPVLTLYWELHQESESSIKEYTAIPLTGRKGKEGKTIIAFFQE